MVQEDGCEGGVGGCEWSEEEYGDFQRREEADERGEGRQEVNDSRRSEIVRGDSRRGDPLHIER